MKRKSNRTYKERETEGLERLIAFIRLLYLMGTL